ncbi:transglutaminase-like cysteine peptidase [Psychrobium sp. 1_MG-2023]|uniref:transglutaminase-like cysteine peptidase n=1 Tax=Psychrobium sp. 1_MG-2023 TaxID=3062624 RepID=UPI00351E3E31
MAKVTIALALVIPSAKAETALFDKSRVVNVLTDNYGLRAGKRGTAWLNILNIDQSVSDREKLEKVNNFFNFFHFVDDIKLWGEENYWATPLEFIGVNGGDCEDYSIAKYFSLLELGVPDKKMRITMVKAKHLNQYHMVLAYYETPTAIPIILDNLDGEIKLATKRKDLLPVYSFNGTQLWLNKEKGKGVLAGKSSRLKKWTGLNQRLGKHKLRQPKLKLE